MLELHTKFSKNRILNDMIIQEYMRELRVEILFLITFLKIQG